MATTNHPRTGPRTAAGKATAARNALRHGLAAAVTEGATQAAAAPMAEKLAPIGAGPFLREAAARLAAAQLAWERVRDARARALARAERAVSGPACERTLTPGICKRTLTPDTSGTGCERTLTWGADAELTAALDELRRLERYARRAWSRRKRAMRAFGRAVTGEANE